MSSIPFGEDLNALRRSISDLSTNVAANTQAIADLRDLIKSQHEVALAQLDVLRAELAGLGTKVDQTAAKADLVPISQSVEFVRTDVQTVSAKLDTVLNLVSKTPRNE